MTSPALMIASGAALTSGGARSARAQNLEIYARCFQWEQKSCVPQFECVEESSNASRSRTRDREIALGAYRLCPILQGCVAISMAHLTVRGKTLRG